jgi:integrase
MTNLQINPIYSTVSPNQIQGGIDMSGSIYKRIRTSKGQKYETYFVKFKGRHIYRHYMTGQFMGMDLATSLLGEMRSEWTRGVFNWDKYLSATSNVISLIDEWYNAIETEITAGVHYGYGVALNKWIRPFFESNPIMLHEIRKSTINRLFRHITLTGASKKNVMDVFMFCLKWALDDERIARMPPFPKRSKYGIQKKVMESLPMDRQANLINAMPEEDRPIFLFWSMHGIRGAECRALLKKDYDANLDIFRIHRSENLRRHYEGTKTGKEYIVPCADAFKPIMAAMPKTFSQYFFSSKRSHQPGQPYTYRTMRKIFRAAREKVGESIGMNQAFRDSFGWQFLNEKGGNLADLQELYHHTSIKTTMRYAKSEVAKLRKNINKKKVVELDERRRDDNNLESRNK